MDCGTCVLMGMCMLCGPGFGGSNTKASLDPGAAEKGRPLTEAEVMTAFDNMFVLLGENVRQEATPVPNIRNTRRHSPDVKYTRFGIGKRNPQGIDPFSLGIQKADLGVADHDSRYIDQISKEIERHQENPMEAILHKSAEDSGMSLDAMGAEKDSKESKEDRKDGRITESASRVSPRSRSKFGLEARLKNNEGLLARTKTFLDNEVKELVARRYRHSPVFTLLGLH
ncbi:unnamed protein product [Lymnaea stagnalis]|uniref:Uncharacterized protein n=1 Tax=Lymnaea stagnalis TaxID=6523 RepID=A0AAV2HN71_LYMST